MNMLPIRRVVRCCLLAISVLVWLAQAQTQGGRISFSIINGEDIVHVSQIEFQTVSGEVSVTSTIGITQRSLLQVQSDEGFERTFVIGNETPREQTFRAILIVDDRQVELSLDGAKKLQHTFSIPTNDQRRLTFAFPGQSDVGLHNFVLVVFYDIQFDSGDIQGILPPYADSVLVGQADPQAGALARPPAEAFLMGQPVSATLSLPPRGLTMSRNAEPDSESDLLSSPLRLGASQPFSYHIHVRNGLPRQGEADEFVLITLVDGVQIPVDARSENIVAYFQLPRNGLATLPAQLDAPEETGLHSLDVLAIRNPYDFLVSMGSLEVLYNGLTLEVN